MNQREHFLIYLLILTWAFLLSFIVYIVSKIQSRKKAIKNQKDFWSFEITRLDIALSEDLSESGKLLEAYKILKEIYSVYYHLKNKDEQCFLLRRLVAYDKEYSSQKQADSSLEKYKKFCDKNRKAQQ